ncbi:MAG: hypothetical protein IPL78_13980 [Chloroflexi bacterium]|nr:hypothetical protein [Chloroflexota bacterium]
MAQKAITRILADSELKEGWEREDGAAAWQAIVLDLQKQLGQ